MTRLTPARRRRAEEVELRRQRQRLVARSRRRDQSQGRYLGQFRPEFSRLHQEADMPWVMPLRARYMLILVGRRFSGRSALLRHLELDRGFAAYNLEDALTRHLVAARAVGPVGAPLRRFAAETRFEEQDAAVIACWAVHDMRLDHLTRSERWRPAPRIAVAGVECAEELAVFTRFSRCAVLSLQLADSVRKDRAISSGWLAEEHADVDLRPLTAREVCSLADSIEVRPEIVSFAEDMGELLSTTIPDKCPRRGLSLTWDAYRQHGFASLYDELDEFVAGLDGRFPAGDF